MTNPFRRKSKSKAPPSDPRLGFIQAGLGEGFSESQLRFLWLATERRPRPTSKLEKEDLAGVAGFLVLLAGFAGWHWQLALIIAGCAIMALAWLSARPVTSTTPPKR